MSDDKPTSPKLEELRKLSFSVKIPRMLIWRNPENSLYYVIKRDSNSPTGFIYDDLRGYRHSTSCYAKLGRMVQQEMALIVQ